MPRNRAHGRTLPPELWLEILSLCTYTPRFLEFQPTDTLITGYTEQDIQATVRTRLSLLFVCKQFYSLAKRFLYEFLYITRMKQLRSLHWSLNLAGDLDHGPDPALWVKRFDFRCANQNNALADETPPTTVFEPAHLVWMFDLVSRATGRCLNLKHFTCQLPMHFNDYMPDPSIIQLFQPGLESLSWGGGLRLPISLMLTSFSNIHVFRLDQLGDLGSNSEQITLDMPNLHTLRASVSVVSSLFPKITLPSLSTLIVERSLVSPAETFRPKAFFEAHGNKIQTLVCSGSFEFIKRHLHHCTNLRNFVVGALNADKIPNQVSDRITLLGISADQMMFNARTPMEPLWDYLCDIIVGSFGHSFHNLAVLRVIDRTMALGLRENNPHGLRVWERRFRGNGIRLEDENGNILLA